MKISSSHTSPSTKELFRILSTEVSGYSARFFGLGTEKTILVKKSAFVGVQITRRENEIIVEGSLPSLPACALSGIFMLDGIFYLFEFLFYTQWKSLEEEIGIVLKKNLS